MGTVTEAHAVTLRALLRGDVRTFHRRLRLLAAPGWDDFLAAAFVMAVDRRFPPTPEPASVIRFVAGVRERYDRTGCEVDPAVAEALVWAALGVRGAPAAAGTVTARTLLVLGLLADEDLTDAEVDAFVTDVRGLHGAAPAREASAEQEVLHHDVGAADGGQGQEADGEPDPRVPVDRTAVVDARLAPEGQGREAGEERQRR